MLSFGGFSFGVNMNLSEQAYEATKMKDDPSYAGLSADYRAELDARASVLGSFVNCA